MLTAGEGTPAVLEELHTKALPVAASGPFLLDVAPSRTCNYVPWDREAWQWFSSNRHWLEVHQLPPYSPELNPAERLWQHTRKNATHNRHFATETELARTLSRIFGEMQSHRDRFLSVF